MEKERQLDGSCGSPFIKVGVTLAAFKASGKIPCWKERSFNYVNGCLKECTRFLETFTGIPCRPRLLFELRLPMSFTVSVFFILLRKKEFITLFFK